MSPDKALELMADPEEFKDGFHLGIKGNTLSIEVEIGKIIYELVLEKKPGLILELGTASGYSTCWFMLGLMKNEKGKIVTIDHIDRQPKIWDEIHIPKGRLEDIICESDYYLKDCKEHFDMCFLDTHHRIENIVYDIERLIPHLNKGATLLIHDTNYIPSMGIELEQYFLRKKVFDYTEIKKSCGLGIATYKGDTDASHT